jgi:hypothetical protein
MVALQHYETADEACPFLGFAGSAFLFNGVHSHLLRGSLSFHTFDLVSTAQDPERVGRGLDPTDDITVT